MRVLCYAHPGDASPLADMPLKTDVNGYPTSGLPGACGYVAALQLLHTQPSGKPNHGPAYWVYATSWSPANPPASSGSRRC